MSRQDYETPPDFMEWVEINFGPRNLDVAASESNALAPKYYSGPCDAALFKAEACKCGLCSGWYGKVWCNPPYNNIGPWVDKATSYSSTHVHTLMLLPASMSTLWMHKLYRYKCRFYFLTRRLKFLINGVEQSNPRYGNVLVDLGYGLGYALSRMYILDWRYENVGG